MIGLVRKVADSYRKRKYVNKNRWQDLVMGDVIEINGKRYMYFMLNQEGGPGHAGRPEPVFTTEKPTYPSTFFYIRVDVGLLAEYEHVFGEGNFQTGFDGQSRICWINSSDYRKVGHITPEQWNKMVEELKEELGGKK